MSSSSFVACGGLVLCAATACGSNSAQPDAPAIADAASDASADALADGPVDAACERTLLVGGTDLSLQGWSVVAQGPHTLTYAATFTELVTSTDAGASRGGQLLLTHTGAVAAGTPFALEIVAQVEEVDAHNQYDAAVAILGSFTGPFGAAVEREQMLYLDSDAIGWADDSQSQAFPVTDAMFHTYVLSVDATGVAQVTIDGTVALTRSGYTTSGTIAIGDQTNEANVDATLRLRSVRLLCP